MKAIYILALLSSTQLSATQLTTEQELKFKAQQITKNFATELKGTLKSAIKKGGFEAGAHVCKTKAPEIAEKYSLSGWKIGRTSLKTRNPLNKPTNKERMVLQHFADSIAQGESVNKLSYSQYNQEKKEYHFMKAIPTGQLCLACHGTAITPPLKDKINELYPFDQAKNFKLGDMRGAFSVTYTPD